MRASKLRLGRLGPEARLLSGVAVMLLLVPAAGAEEWPQWRGSGGLGVSDAVGLPEEWGPDSDNIRWRVKLPGDGISSPIVSSGRVFLTTAYEGPGSAIRDLLLRSGLVAASLAFVWLALGRRREALAKAGALDATANKALRRTVHWVVALSLFFALVAILMAVRPDLFLEAGNPGRSWRAGSTMALLGLAVATGWFRPASRGRLLAALAVLAITANLALNIPAGPMGPIPVKGVLGAVLPGLIGGLWGIVSHVWAFRRAKPLPAAASFYDPRLALPAVAMALLIFVPPNYLSGLQRVVLALDLDSGELLWERPVFQAPPEQKWPRGSYATPTPATDGESVFAYFGSGMASLDFDGRIQWMRRFPKYTGHTRYGAGTSPVLTDDSVLIIQESEMYQAPKPSWFAALEKRSGEPNWRVEPGDVRDSYATPLLLQSPSGDQMVTASWHLLLGYDAETGERLWSLDTLTEQTVASMARSGDLVAVTGGVVGDKRLTVVRVGDPATGAAPEVLWESRSSVAAVPSPVIYRGMLFTVTRNGIMTNYDVETGDRLWRKRLDGEYFASLVAGDGKVYATNSEGASTVIAAEAEYREISVNELANGVYASAAIAGGGLLIRAANELFFIEGTQAAGGGEPTIAE